VQNLFLYTRFFFFLLLIIALVIKKSRGTLKEEVFLLLFALLALFTDALDQLVLTSNLELYAVFNFIATFFVLGFCNRIFSLKKWLWLPIVLIGSYTLFIFLSDFSLLSIISKELIYSDYGFLHAGEMYNLRLLSSFVILPYLFFSIYRETMNSDSFSTSNKTYFALFGFIVLYSVPFLWYLLGRVLIDTDSYNPVAEIVIPTSFVLSYSLLSAAVLWKK
jgi:hypothetical protein